MNCDDILSIENPDILKTMVFEDHPDYVKFQAVQRYVQLTDEIEFLHSLLFSADLSRSLKISLSTLVDDYQTLLKFSNMIDDPMLNVHLYLEEEDSVGEFYRNNGKVLTNEFAYLISKLSHEKMFDAVQKHHSSDRIPNACAQYIIMKLSDPVLLRSLKFILPAVYQPDINFQIGRLTR